MWLECVRKRQRQCLCICAYVVRVCVYMRMCVRNSKKERESVCAYIAAKSCEATRPLTSRSASSSSATLQAIHTAIATMTLIKRRKEVCAMV